MPETDTTLVAIVAASTIAVILVIAVRRALKVVTFRILGVELKGETHQRGASATGARAGGRLRVENYGPGSANADGADAKGDVTVVNRDVI